jgi:hypothetical protein
MGSDRSRATRAAFAMSFSIVLFASSPALGQPAQQPQQPTASDRETARALMAEGRDKRDAGDLAGALKAFVTADSIMHVPTTGLEVARTQDKMGRLLEARETLIAVLRIPVQPSDPPPFAEARKAAEALDADLAKRIPTLVVEPTSDVDGPITVTIDDQPIPSNLVVIPRKLNPGKHVVVARAGSEEARETVSLAQSEQKRLPLRITKRAPPPAVVVKAEPEPVRDHPTAEGTRPIPIITWIGGGVAVAGVLTGTVAGIVSISKTNSLEGCVGDQCPRDQQSTMDSARTFATISDVSFVVGGIGAVVAAVGYFVLRPEAKPASVTIGPTGVAGTF